MRPSSPRAPWLVGAAGAALLCVGLRLVWIREHGRDLPFHDQWDAEFLHLLRPWLQGEDLARHLFRFHNEHHPVFTKLLALAGAWADGMWSALPQLLANTLLQATNVLLVARLAARHLAGAPALLVAAIAGLVLGLPLLWENGLWGFQSQFHLAALLGLLHLDLTWSRPTLGARWWLGLAAGVATLGTIAAGFLAVTASGLVALARLRGDPAARRHGRATLAAAIVISAAGLALVHPVPYAATARDPFTALHAATQLLRWPFHSAMGVAWALLPGCLLIAGNLLRAGSRPARPWLLAVALWLVAMVAAFAYGRAELIAGATNRYRDILCLQLLVGCIALLAWVAAQDRHRLAARLLAGAWVGLGTWAFHGALRDLREPAERAAFQDEQIALVRSHLRAGTATVFEPSVAAALLHDSAEQRRSLLSDPKLRAYLPPSVRAPLAIRAAADTAGFRAVTPADVDLLPRWEIDPSHAGPARFSSELVEPGHLRLARLRVAGTLDGRSVDLRLEAADGRVLARPLGTGAGREERAANLPVPNEPFRLVVEAAPAAGPFSFSAPVELGRLTWVTGKVLRYGGVLQFLGVACLVVAAVRLRAGRQQVAAESPAAPPRHNVIGLVAVAGATLIGGALFVWPRPLVLDPSSRNAALFDPARWGGKPAMAADSRAGAGAGRGQLPPEVVGREFLVGTYSDSAGDAAIVRLRLGYVVLDQRWLNVPIAGHPGEEGRTLAWEILDAEGETLGRIACDRPAPGLRPDLWSVDVTAHRGRRALLLLEDRATGHGGWLAAGDPWTSDVAIDLASWRRLAASNRVVGVRLALLSLGLGLLAWCFWSSRRATPSGWLWP